MRRLAVWVAVLWAAGAPAGAAPTPTEGVVLDGTGAPLAGAMVRAFLPESSATFAGRVLARRERGVLGQTLSGADGRFSLDLPVEAGRIVELAVTRDGHGPIQRPVRAGEGVSGLILPRAPSIAGSLRDAQGTPRAGSWLIFYAQGGASPAWMVTSDDRGGFVAPDPASWASGFSVVAAGEAPWMQFAGWNGARAIPAHGHITLPARVVVRGTTVGPKGTALAGVDLRVGDWTVTRSDAQGRFSLAIDPRAPPRLIARHPGSDLAAFAIAADGLRLSLAPRAARRLEGQVLDGSTKTGLEGARISLVAASADGVDRRSAVTDRAGRFAFADVAPDRYSVGIEAPGFRFRQTGEIADLRAGEPAPLRFVGERHRTLTGRVADSHGRPVARAVVSFTDLPVVAYLSLFPGQTFALTDAAGLFSLPIDEGQSSESRLLVTHPEWPATRSAPLALGRGAVPLVQITLEPGVEVSGRVVDENNAPLADVGIAILERDPDQGFTVPLEMFTHEQGFELPHTTADGGFRFVLRPALHDLGFSMPGYAPRAERGLLVTLATSRAPLRIVLRRGVVLRGKVVDERGQGIEGVGLTATRAMAGATGAEASPTTLDVTSDEAGAFQIDGLEAGAYQLLAQNYEAGIFEERALSAPATDIRIVVPDGVSLRGRVIDEMTLEPIAEATVITEAVSDGRPVEAESRGVTSAADGYFLLSRVGPGRRHLRALAQGYIAGRPVEVDLEEPGLRPGATPATIELPLRRGATISGIVRSPAGKPLSGIEARLAPPQPVEDNTHFTWGDQPEAVSGDDGTYRLDGIAPGENHIVFRGGAWRALERTVVIAENAQPVRLDVTMRRGRTLSGIVRDPAGVPLAEVYVIVTNQAGPGAQSAVPDIEQTYQDSQTDDEGKFSLRGLPDGPLELSADRKGFRSRSLSLLDAGLGSPIEIVLEPLDTGTVSGSVVGFSGEWLMKQVLVRHEEEESDGPIDSAGRFRVTDVPAGAVTVTAHLWRQDRSRTASATAEVIAGAETEVRIEFEPGHSLSGQVTRRGEPVAFVDVVLETRGGGGSLSTKTDADGEYGFEDVENGSWGLTVRPDRQGHPRQTVLEVRGATRYDVELDTASLNGLVRLEAGGPGLSGVDIALEAADSERRDLLSLPQLKSDRDGRFVVEGLPAGAVVVRAESPGYGQAIQTVEIPESGAVSVELVLEEHEGLRVTLIDTRTGGAVRGTVVALSGPPGNRQLAFDGKLRIEGDALRLPIAPGRYVIAASATGLATVTIESSVPGPDVAIPLSPGGTLAVRSRQPARRLAKLVLPTGEEYVRCWCDRIADLWLEGARTSFENIAAGDYTLVVFGRDNQRSRYPVRVVEGRTTDVEVE